MDLNGFRRLEYRDFRESPFKEDGKQDEINEQYVKRRMEERQQKAQAALDRLAEMPGLESIKEQVDQMVGLAKIAKHREAMGLKCEKQSLHMIFTGNPGTGKTTAARLIGEAYVAMGLIKNDGDDVPFVEVHHADVEHGMVGRAEDNMSEKFDEARGGVLFMDEAYAFSGPHHYHKTFMANLVQKIEDMRDEVLVIAAGYPNDMEDFLNNNPGLRSRFSTVVDFKDYDIEELVKIAEMMCAEREYEMTDGYKKLLTERLEKESKQHSFGNARTVRNIIEQSIRIQANRLAKHDNLTKDALVFLTPNDIDTTVRIIPKEVEGKTHNNVVLHAVVSGKEPARPREIH